MSDASDHDQNPFRPEGELSVEVKPIVESFRTRPYPASPEKTLDLVDSASAERQPLRPHGGSPLNGHAANSRGRGPGGDQSSFKNRGTAEVQLKTVVASPAHQAHVVHIEDKKKRCCSCSIQ